MYNDFERLTEIHNLTVSSAEEPYNDVISSKHKFVRGEILESVEVNAVDSSVYTSDWGSITPVINAVVLIGSTNFKNVLYSGASGNIRILLNGQTSIKKDLKFVAQSQNEVNYTLWGWISPSGALLTNKSFTFQFTFVYLIPVIRSDKY